MSMRSPEPPRDRAKTWQIQSMSLAAFSSAVSILKYWR